jgi:glycosyltransferase involved in cell wall biosynthesis
MREKLRQRFALRGKCSSSVGAFGTDQNSRERSAIGELKRTLLDWAFAFPDPECEWRAPAVHEGRLIGGRHRPDVVLATGGPWTSLLVGRQLAKRFRVPFVADFRDPWTANPYHTPPAAFLSQRAKVLEHAVCKSASWIIANTEELAARFREHYPDIAQKVVTITNGFNLRPQTDERDGVDGADRSSSGIELSFFGTLYGNGNPLPLLQAVQGMSDDVGSDQLRLRFVGTWEIPDARCESLARDLEKRGYLRREPPLSHDICLREMSRASLLLIMQPHSPLQIPAKTYEYISTGRPILVLGGDGATANLVENHRLGLCCPNQMPKIKELLYGLVTGRVRIPTPPEQEVGKFHYRNIVGRVAAVLADACEARS